MNVVSKLARGFAYAVAALFALNAQADAAKPFDAYVQDGLIAQWDCADLDHLDATGWTDTSGKYKFEFRGTAKGNITYSDGKGVYLPDNAFGYIVDASTTFALAGNGTMEIVFAQTAENKNGNMLLQSSTGNKIGLLLKNDGDGAMMFNPLSSSGGHWSLAYTANAVRMVSVDYTNKLDQKGVLLDGNDATDWNLSGQNWTHNGFTGTVLGGYANTSNPSTCHAGWSFIGKIMSVRLYSTKLSVAQKAANFEVDRRRFVEQNLTIAPSENGSVSCEFGNYAAPNCAATLTVKPDEGYVFSGWTGDASGTTHPLVLNLSSVTPTTVGATFAQIPPEEAVHVQIDCSASQTYKATVGGVDIGSTVVAGSTITVVATPIEGREYPKAPTGWTRQGVSITRDITAVADPTVITIPEASLETYGWAKRVDLKLDKALATTEITTGLPTLVRLSESSIEGFEYSVFEQADGSDMLFTCNGNRIPHEIDTWNPSGESLVWIRLPSTAQDTTVTMFFGRAVKPTDKAPLTWDGYSGVWHLSENSNGVKDTTVKDSTANHYDGTAYAGTTANGQTVAGKLGNGWQISSATTTTGGGIIMDSMKNAKLGSQFTVSGWVNHNTSASWSHIFYRKKAGGDAGGYAIEVSGASWTTKTSVRGGVSSTAAALYIPDVRNNWGHIAYAYDGTKAYLVNNGVAAGNGTIVAATDNGLAPAFGNDSDRNDYVWCGSMDELRIRKGAYDANYLAAEYKAMGTDLFTFGAVVDELYVVTFNTPTDVAVSVKVDGAEIASGTKVAYGKDVVVVATPKQNYEFVTIPDGWTKVTKSDAITRTYTVQGADVTIDVPSEIAEKPQYTLTLNVGANGSVSGATSGQTFYRDAEVTLTATANEGYYFAGWTDDAEGLENPLTVTIDGNKTIGATFAAKATDDRFVSFDGGTNTAFAVTVDDEPIESGAVVKKGKTVVAVATPVEHYAFTSTPEGWTACEPAGSLTRSITVADEDINFVIPSAELIMHQLTITQPTFGSISGTASGSYADGTSVTLTANLPDESYEFLGWTDDAAGLTANPLAFTLTNNTTVGANIVKIARAVTFEAPANATVSVTVDDNAIQSGDLVEYGKSVVVVSSPADADYEYLTAQTGWTKSGSGITRTYTMANEALALEIPAPTAIPYYTLTLNAGENGSITGTAGSYKRGTVVQLTAVPNENYKFAHWTGVAAADSLKNPLSVTLTGDKTVGAVFRATVDADRYVQDGLVTMWDCRTGYTTSGWTDLSGQYTFNFTGTFGESAAKGIGFDGKSYGMLSPASTTAAFGQCYYGTIEYVFAPDKDPATCNMMVCKWTSACCLWEKTNFSVDRTGKKIANWNENPSNKVTTISVRYNGSGTASAETAFQNGVALTRSNGYGNWGEKGNGYGQLGCFWWSNNTSVYPQGYAADVFSGKIYAIRLYSRKLTDAEIAQNAKLDKQRFGKKGMVIAFR